MFQRSMCFVKGQLQPCVAGIHVCVLYTCKDRFHCSAAFSYTCVDRNFFIDSEVRCACNLILFMLISCIRSYSVVYAGLKNNCDTGSLGVINCRPGVLITCHANRLYVRSAQ